MESSKYRRNTKRIKQRTKKIKYVEQTGGLKLGQGSFGCVITPPIKCPNSTMTKPAFTNQTEISKIVYTNPASKFKYDREMSILRLISTVDKKQHYLIGLIDECELDIAAIMTRKIKDTVIVEFTNSDRSNWKIPSSLKTTDLSSNNKQQSVQIDSGLKNLSKREIKSNFCLVDPKLKPRNQIQINGGMPFDNILDSHKSRTYAFVRRYYLNVIRDILVGIQLMHKARIAHRDIKESNMVCQTIPLKRKGRPNDFYPVVRHIDFGLAEIVDPKKTYLLKDVRYAGTVKYIPPDILLMSSRSKNMALIVGADTSNSALHKLSDATVKSQIITELTERLNEKDYYDFSVLGILPRFATGANTNTKAKANINSDDFIHPDDLRQLYDLLLKELLDGTFSHKYSKDYDGYLYKTDIFAAGVTIASIRYELGIHNPKLFDLVANMVRINPNTRFNIHQCLSHPLFKN